MGESGDRMRGQFKARTVLVADGKAPDRELIVGLLERIGLVPYEAETGVEALALAETVRPDAYVLDVELPLSSGYEVCHELRARFGECVPIVLASGTRVSTLDRVAAFLIGADDYVTKPFDPDEVLVRVRSLLRRNGHHANGHPPHAEVGTLTPREREVLVLLARGRNQSDIAAELVVTPKTVATHIQRVLSKLGLHSRAEAVAYAHRQGLTAAASVPDFEPHTLVAAATYD